MSDYSKSLPAPLLQTKLFQPAPRAELVGRPRLIERLNSGLGDSAQNGNAKLLLICAPAGFGKTTLVSTWLTQAAKVGTAWLSLDESDNDPVLFLAYLIAALQVPVPGAGETAVPLLQSPEPPPAAAVLSLLINDISRNERPIILVLEDYHLITAAAIHAALIFLLEHLPPLLHLLIITRSDPPLHLSRLRAGNQLVEIRADELRFTLGETSRFFSQVMGLNLSTEETAALERRTEGWIAGLQLAALSIKGHDDRSDFIAAFTGSHRFILDYLTDEVLSQRPKGTKNFLLQTAILDRFCGPLCTAVTGQSDSQAILERMEQANLFLIPLDDERRWYRYHHLFAEALRQNLQQTQAGLLPDLHWRAQEWFQQNGYMAEAVAHALAGGHFEQAALLIERVAGNMVRNGSGSSLVKWLDTLPEETVHTRPRLCLARGWTYIMGPAISLPNAEQWVGRALQTVPEGQALESDIAGEVASLQAIIAAIWDEVARSIELARQALASLPPDSPWRSVTTFTLGSALFLFGDMAASAQALEEALALSQADGAQYIQLNAASFLGDIQVFEGHLDEALNSYQQVLAWSKNGLPQKGALMAHAGLAHIFYERNQLDEALAHVQLGTEQLEQVGGAWAALVLNRALARIKQAGGHGTEALDALESAYQAGWRTQVAIVLAQSAALRARLYLGQGNLAAAEEWAEGSGLSPDDLQAGHPGLREEEYLVLARVLSARGEQAAADSLLERLLQSAQAEERHGSAIFILILRSLIFQAQNKMTQAYDSLERALILAEPEGYIRAFVDEGAPLRTLILDYRAVLAARAGSTSADPARRRLAYTHKLLAEFPLAEPSDAQEDASTPDPLSERELEVLGLIAAGASNRQIADTLVLAVPTVKKHVSNILSKLNAANRTQAIAEARTLGLL